MGGKKNWGKKNSGRKNVESKKILVKKNHGSITFLGPKRILCTRKFASEKYFSYKIVGSKLFLGWVGGGIIKGG